MKILISALILLIIITMYMLLDYSLGRKRHLATLQKRDYPVRNSTISIFKQGDRLFEDFFSELSRANNHIHILFFIVKNDNISKRFFEILIQKASEGIEVRLLLDQVGSHKIPKKKQVELKAAGIEFSYCNKIKPPFIFYSSQVRNHRKITVIDGKIGYMGGFNIGEEYIDMNPKLTPWRDYHLKITGEGVQDLQREFLNDWKKATRKEIEEQPKYYPALEKGVICHQFVPTDGVFLEDTFCEQILNAKESIFIGTPYFIPSSKVFHVLKKALEKGIKVTLLVPNISDHPLVKEASFRYLRVLLKEGLQVYQFINGFYHAKILIIDEEYCDIGTANFDMRSFFLNYEMNCYIYNKTFMEQVMMVVKNDLQDAKLLSRDALDQPGLMIRVKEVIARPISYFL